MDDTTDHLATFPLEPEPVEPGADARPLTLLAHVDWMDVPPEARGTGYVVINHEERLLPPRGFVLVSSRKSWRERMMAKLRRS